MDVARPPSSDGTPARRAWVAGPEPAAQAGSWRSLSDDDLLLWLEDNPSHSDKVLLEIVASERHFYVRQMAALQLNDPETLKRFADDRHVGQILARRLARDDDVDYLRELVRRSRHLEVRSAALAQLRALAVRLRMPSIVAESPLSAAALNLGGARVSTPCDPNGA